MKVLTLPKRNLDFFASVVQQFGEVHGPVEQDGRYVFRRLNRWSEIRLTYPRTILPPRKYLLPPRETLFRYEPGQGYIPVTDGLDGRVVLFGVHACDIFALNILDNVFGAPYPDPYYQARRRRLVVVGIDCIPDEHCFCRSMRADFVDRGFDLFLHDIGDSWLTMVGTATGDDMVLASGTLFAAPTEQDFEQYKLRSGCKRAAFRLEVEIRDLPEIFELEYNSELWSELGDKCLSCGNCSMVCPTCYCYDVADQPELGSTSGIRARFWDSCLYSTHAAVAGGESFRGTAASRLRFRCYHKQRGFVAEHGRPGCVGCGRCIEACPAGIDIVEVLNRLRGVEHAARH